MKNKVLKGVVVSNSGNMITILVDGENKVFINDIFNLKAGELVKFEVVNINHLKSAVIYDKVDISE
jgi:hypothetical protein